MPELTKDQVRERLGLRPFAEFAAARREANKTELAALHGTPTYIVGDLKNRGTGRTTELLCEAIAHSSAGRVVFIDASTYHAQRAIQSGAHARARQLGVEFEFDARRNIHAYTAMERGRLAYLGRVPADAVLLVDHTEHERRLEIQK